MPGKKVVAPSNEMRNLSTARNRPETKTPTGAVGVMARKHKDFRVSEMVRLAGIEPTTLGFGGQYSIH